MPADVHVRRWVPRLLALVALGLVLWTLWLTVSLPSRHVAQNYDVAWIGFDLALAAATGTMLVCDAWFDVVMSNGGGERLEAVVEAAFAELPLAAICAYIV